MLVFALVDNFVLANPRHHGAQFTTNLFNLVLSATATQCVSAVPAVVAAEPGIKSYLDLPMDAGRAAAHLR